jgi:hypothetical protein
MKMFEGRSWDSTSSYRKSALSTSDGDDLHHMIVKACTAPMSQLVYLTLTRPTPTTGCLPLRPEQLQRPR